MSYELVASYYTTLWLRVTHHNKPDLFWGFCTNFFWIYFRFSSYQISKRVFELTRSESATGTLQPEVVVLSGPDAPNGNFVIKDGNNAGFCLGKNDLGDQLLLGKENRSDSVPFELYKRRTTAFVRREAFLDIVCDALAEYKYVGPNQRADLVLACRYENIFIPLLVLHWSTLPWIERGKKKNVENSEWFWLMLWYIGIC